MTPPVVRIQDTPPGPSSRDPSPRKRRLLEFVDPVRVWTGRRLDEVIPALEAAEAWADDGGWSVGFLAYEAAPALDPNLVTRPPSPDGLPLFWWAAYDRPRIVSPRREAAQESAEAVDLQWTPSLDPASHRAAVASIRRRIEAGDTYQVNLTFALEAAFDGDPEAFFRAVTAAQRARYGAYLDLGDQVIVSASPELFFRLDGDRVVTRPMKGTSRRGRYPEEDELRRRELRSEKNRAENLMILDMMRNDLGRIAEPGSVRVSRLFHTETYPTVHQLVSEARCRTRASRVDLLRALFPCASITGAPKIRTSELIAELENRPRGLYTGALGYFGPGRTAQMSVAIRTAVIDRRRAVATYGTGGGIVWDSDADAEYDECRTKALVLSRSAPAFDLLETLAWRPKSGYFLLDRHVERLLASARYFARPADEEQIRRTLDRLAHGFADDGRRRRARLTVDVDGRVEASAELFPCAGRRKFRAAVDDRPVDAEDVFLFHKTTHREVYDRARQRRPDLDEVLLWNADGELTEGTIGNLVLRFGDRLLTPRVDAGLLAGTYRAELLARGRIHEAHLHRSSLETADAVFLINSVRGWIPLDIRIAAGDEQTNKSGPSPAFVSEPRRN